MVTVSKQEYFGLEQIGIFPITDSLNRLPYLRLSLPLKPGFHMIVGDRSRSLGSLVKCSAIVTIIWKPNFSFCQRSPTIPGTVIKAIIAIVNDCQGSQKVNGNHQCSDCSDRNDRNDPSNHMETSTAIATILTITAIVCVLQSERSQRLYGNQTSAIVTIAAIECFQ